MGWLNLKQSLQHWGGSLAALIVNGMNRMHYTSCFSADINSFCVFLRLLSLWLLLLMHIWIIIADVDECQSHRCQTCTCYHSQEFRAWKARRYLPSNKALWKCTADQEHVNADKNPYQRQADADREVNQQEQEDDCIFGKPEQRHNER